MANLRKDIEAEYIRYSQKWEVSANALPFGSTLDNFGGRHLEVCEDGKLALVGTDRGMETER